MNDDYLSKERTTAIKGLLALMVLIHHTYQKTLIGSSVLLFDFTMRSLGFYCVSSFLFLSGYGLFSSFKNGGGYSSKFLQKRVLPLYIINVILVLVYTIQKFIILDGVEIQNIIKTITFGGNVVDYGWYMQCIILFYVLFYLGMLKTPKQVPIFVLLGISLYVVTLLIFNMPSHWYISSMAFPAGMLWSNYKVVIDNYLAKHYKVTITFILVLFSSSFIILYKRPFEGGVYTLIMIAISMIYGLLFTYIVLLIMMRTKQNYHFINYLSNCFLEIYVLQGFVFNFLRNKFWTVDSALLFVGCSIIGTIMLAKIVHPLFCKIINAFN